MTASAKASLVIGLALAGGLLMAGCAPEQSNALDDLAKVHMRINDVDFELWVADTPETREKGLMFVTAEQMSSLPDGTQRGMIFVFEYEQYLSFWMRNTIIPLDVAYLDKDGIVVAIHTMVPLDERPFQYPSDAPAQYAIEFNANLLGTLGVSKGDRLEIPTDQLKRVP